MLINTTSCTNIEYGENSSATTLGNVYSHRVLLLKMFITGTRPTDICSEVCFQRMLFLREYGLSITMIPGLGMSSFEELRVQISPDPKLQVWVQLNLRQPEDAQDPNKGPHQKTNMKILHQKNNHTSPFQVTANF